MLTKITAVGIVTGVTVVMLLVIASIAIPEYAGLADEEAEKEKVNVVQKESVEPITTSDVVMPTKASRPGCEETGQCYIPSVITIQSGKPITWVNEDSAFHSVTSGSYDVPTELFDSGYMDPYDSFTFTFDDAGTYDYFCTLHPWMYGQVVVK